MFSAYVSQNLLFIWSNRWNKYQKWWEQWPYHSLRDANSTSSDSVGIRLLFPQVKSHICDVAVRPVNQCTDFLQKIQTYRSGTSLYQSSLCQFRSLIENSFYFQQVILLACRIDPNIFSVRYLSIKPRIYDWVDWYLELRIRWQPSIDELFIISILDLLPHFLP